MASSKTFSKSISGSSLSLLLALTLAVPAGMTLANALGSGAAQAHALRPAYRVVTVESAAGLLDAIGPDRTIILKPNAYDLSAKMPIKHPDYLEYDKDTGGLVIKNVRNLRLIGSDVRATKVVISQHFANVLSFKDSSGIEIRSIEFGHIPQSDSICLGAVLAFTNSRNIHLSDVNLFGSGTFGLWLENSRNLILDNSVIKECSQGIAFLSASRQIAFSNSTFVNNAGGLNLWDGSEAMVSGSRFVHNHAERSLNYAKTLFEVRDTSRLLVQGSRLTDNTATGLLGQGGKAVRFRGNYMLRNRYSAVH